jgi:hypothetical protein
VNEAKESPRDTRRFSSGWCFGAAAFHFAATFAIAGLHFMAGMAAFTQDTSSEIAFWRGVQWVWTPLAMAAWDPHKSISPGSLTGLAFLWSCVVGIVAGFLRPVTHCWLHKPLYPPATLHDNSRNA